MPQKGDIQEPVAAEGAEIPEISVVAPEASLPTTENGHVEVISLAPSNGEVTDVGGSSGWVDITPDELEHLRRSPGFLSRLYSLDQDYIDERLDQEHEIRIQDATILSIDVAGFSTLITRAYEMGDKPSLAARKVALLMDDLRERIAGIVRNYGGKMDNFLGDGTNILFEGDQSVQRAATAARDIR
ncbi:MAG: hypothetical protein WC400_01490, partial [Patescibacteria group bacterium]